LRSACVFQACRTVRSTARGKANRKPAGSLRDCVWNPSDLDEIICDMIDSFKSDAALSLLSMR
jgi:hypothetical protein